MGGGNDVIRDCWTGMQSMLAKRRWIRIGLVGILICCGVAPAGAEEQPALRFDVKRFVVEGDNPLSARVTDKVLAPFLGPHEGLTRIEAAAGALEATLVARGYAFHRAVIPPQNISGGVVVIKMIAFTLNNLAVENNSHFSEANVRRALPLLTTGAELNSLAVSRALQMTNEHPTRRLAVFVQKSRVPATVDARIEVADRRPYRIYATFNNTGEPETGDYRLSLGVQHANLFDRDHMVTLSYTTSPEYTGDVNQGGINYRFPVYGWNTWFSAFYTRSEIDQGLVGGFFEVSGKGSFYGAAADHRLRPIGAYQHRLSLGLQDRLFENDTLFGIENLGSDVRSRPLSLTYGARWEKPWGMVSYQVEGAANLGGGADNDERAYTLNRPGSDPDWSLLRYGLDSDVALYRRWRLRARISGQYTGDPLISGEQFGIGGYRSVRGYYEREVTGDWGEQATIEVLTPPQFIAFQPVVFFDIGRIQRHDPHPGAEGQEVLKGAGVGLRWFWKDRVSVTLDIANALDDAVRTESGDWRAHFNIFCQF
jgi:hemolysin activation/secretion protein